MDIIAHLNPETGQEQLLIDHLLNTAKNASEIGEKVGFKYTSILLGLLHDLGKADPLFQKYIRGENKGRVNHSSAGSRFLKELIDIEFNRFDQFSEFSFYFFENILYYAIQAHHGLFNCVDSYKDEYNIERRINNYDDSPGYDYKQVLKFSRKLENTISRLYKKSITDILLLSYDEFLESSKKLKLNLTTRYDEETNYYISLYIRLFLSILKNADVKDTINAYGKVIEDKDFSQVGELFYKSIEEKYNSYGKATSDINIVRTNISEAIKERAFEDETGIYKLSLPTGAGKTMVSLRYSSIQMCQRKKERLFYITAFLSVLEQNANEIKETFKSDENILEHHSNMINMSLMDENDDEDIDQVYREYLLDTWESPCVLTTMVQFFNTLYKGQSANLRRFSSLINSIVVLDEVQSLPIKVTYHMNLMFNFLKKVMNCSLILCTATQPIYDNSNMKYKLEYGNSRGDNQDLYELSDSDMQIFRRVKAFYLSDQGSDFITNSNLINHIYDRFEHENKISILSISNTKSQTLKLYKEFIDFNSNINIIDENNIYYLSTNLYPKHRKRVIDEVKKKLKNNENVVLFSTQIVEAGVDIDFKYVYRSLAGIDSIIQAAGRCNREGKEDYGIIYLYNTDEENLLMLKEINDKKNITQTIVNQTEAEINLETLNDQFFKKYFSKHADEMYYIIKEKKNKYNLFNKLSNNETVELPDNETGFFKQDFDFVARKFDLIEDQNTIDVIIDDRYENLDYGEKSGSEIILELEEACNKVENYDMDSLTIVKEKLIELQQYTISLYDISDYKESIVSYFTDSKSKGILIYKGSYDQKFGIDDGLDTLNF